MTIDEFAAAVELPDDLRPEAFAIFADEDRAPRKTLAHRCADLADGLRQIGAPEAAVHAAVMLLAQERRR